MRKPQLSIVIPVFNEEGNLASVLEAYKQYGRGYNFELICVNNGSTDNSGRVLKRYAMKKDYRFIEVITIKKNIGYGHGIMTGVKRTKGDSIAWTHADMQTHPADVFRAYDVYRKLGSSKIIVKGSRVGRQFLDSFVSLWMGIIATLLLRMSLYEINAQPKLFHQSLVPYLSNPPDDFLLDLYLLYIAKKHQYKTSIITVRFYKRKHGASKWAYSLRSRLKMVRRTMQYAYQLAGE